jgi:hypothetical protein
MPDKTDAQTTDDYVTKLHKFAKSGKAVELHLETDDRVLARVTDGIYRQPASAIRELIANAYDADASEVTVITDAPRYSSILVRDNGNGMSAQVLINMIRHIGGSAKRTNVGQELGVTRSDDANSSPGGRLLIGKMGIGLFSVAQLTRQFTIITKPKSENYRYTAVVTLHRYTDDELGGKTNEAKYRTGETAITSEEVSRNHKHGTTIVLGDLIPRARRLLQSEEVWFALHNPPEAVGAVRRVPPVVHSGYTSTDATDTFTVKPEVPWTKKTPPDQRMENLWRAVIEAAKQNELYSQIDNAFDYYFRMLWSLSLSLPLPYIHTYPFDLPGSSAIKAFLLSNRSKATSGVSGDNQASDLKVGPKTTAGTAANIDSKREGSDFNVEVDGIRLLRPIRFDEVMGSSRALQTPLLFVGKFSPDLSKFDKNQRGGHDLEFSGYFCWTPRVVPKEHNGVLIRIHGASGTLFDSTFLNYQIAERQRLKQLVGEIFVSKGLEEALNIDRESFNTSHPHYQIVLNWVHNSLRQIFNKQKELETNLRSKRIVQNSAKSQSAIHKTRDEELQRILGDDADSIRAVTFTDDESEAKAVAKRGDRVFSLQKAVASAVVENVSRVTASTSQKVLVNAERGTAIAQLLDAYELLDLLSPEQQQELIRGIIRIFNSGE